MCVLTGVAMNLQLLCLKALSISMRKAANIRLHVWGERGFYFLGRKVQKGAFY